MKALIEMNRVLTPGGIALIIDMNRNASNQQIKDYIRNIESRGMHKLFMELIFKFLLRNAAYTEDELVNLISKTAFKEYVIKEVKIGFHIYLNKGEYSNL